MPNGILNTIFCIILHELHDLHDVSNRG